MRTVHNYVVEIDPEYLEKRGSLYTPTQGTDYERLPKHGTVIGTKKNSKVKQGDVAYFYHYALDTRWKEDGKTYISVDDELMIGYSKKLGKAVKSTTTIVSERIEQKETVKSSVIILPKEIEHYAQKFKVTAPNKKVIDGIEKGDVVWSWKDSDYSLDYIPEVIFLEARLLVYNETKDELLNGYVLVKPLDTDDKDFVKDGLLYLPAKQTVKQKGLAEVVKCNKNDIIKEGDKVIFNRTSHSRVMNGLNAVKFEDIKAYE